MSTFGGMEWWNGIVEWTTGMVECFIGHTYNHPACVVQWVNSELYICCVLCMHQARIRLYSLAHERQPSTTVCLTLDYKLSFSLFHILYEYNQTKEKFSYNRPGICILMSSMWAGKS